MAVDNWNQRPYTDFATAMDSSNYFFVWLHGGSGSTVPIPFTLGHVSILQNEASCAVTATAPQPSAGAPNSTSTGVIKVLYTCTKPGMALISFDLVPQSCAPITITFHKTNGNALDVGLASGQSNIVALGVTKSSFNYKTPTYTVGSYQDTTEFFIQVDSNALPISGSQFRTDPPQVQCYEAGGAAGGIIGCTGSLSGNFLASSAIGKTPMSLVVTYGCKVNGPVQFQLVIKTPPFDDTNFSLIKFCGMCFQCELFTCNTACIRPNSWFYHQFRGSTWEW